MGVTKKFSPSQISQHTTKKDCWLLIHGKVYDVTKFLEDHPGGDDVLLQASANGDATQKFQDVGHSSTATGLMEGFLIGFVEGYEGSAVGGGAPKPRRAGAAGLVKAKPLKEKKPSPYSSFLDLLFPALILGLAFAWYYLTFDSKAKA